MHRASLWSCKLHTNKLKYNMCIQYTHIQRKWPILVVDLSHMYSITVFYHDACTLPWCIYTLYWILLSHDKLTSATMLTCPSHVRQVKLFKHIMLNSQCCHQEKRPLMQCLCRHTMAWCLTDLYNKAMMHVQRTLT